MTIKSQIRSAYASHLVTTFGADGLALFHALPDFTAILVAGEAHILPSDAAATDQNGMLLKAVELYANQYDVTVNYNGFRYVPSPLKLAA